MKKYLFNFFLAIALTSSATVLAQEVTNSKKGPLAREGSGARGGGDVELVRRAEIADFIQNQLKPELKQFFALVSTWEISDLKVRNWISDLMARGIQNDIDFTPYEIQGACHDEAGNEKSASTQMGGREQPICFNLERLAERGVLSSELLGLAAHEHARHFNIDDTDEFLGHKLGAFVASNIFRIHSNLKLDKENSFIVSPMISPYFYLQVSITGANGTHCSESEMEKFKKLVREYPAMYRLDGGTGQGDWSFRYLSRDYEEFDWEQKNAVSPKHFIEISFPTAKISCEFKMKVLDSNGTLIAIVDPLKNQTFQSGGLGFRLFVRRK